MLKNTFSEFASDRCMLLSAALAFYTALSFAPALVLAIWVTGLLGPATQEQIVDRVAALTGQGGGEVVRTVDENADSNPTLGSIASIAAALGLLLSATTLFAQVQQALNVVWNVKPKPNASFLHGLVRKRLLSFLMLLLVLVLLLGAVVASTVLTRIAGAAGAGADSNGWLWQALNAVISIVIFTLVVAAIFKYLPDVIIGWRSVWLGASITGVLLVLGKFLTGLYLGRGAAGSAYGAGGAFFVLLLWMYYSWAIVLLGAEFTQVWARRHHHQIQPDHRSVAVNAPG